MHNQIRVFVNDEELIIGETIRKILSHEEDIEFKYCPDPTKALQEAIKFKPTLILQD